jgi:hypothetical protein
MKSLKILTTYFLVWCMLMVFLPFAISASDIPDPKTYIPSLSLIFNNKSRLDDPRPFTQTIGVAKVLPKEMYEKLTYDVVKMKETWADIVGFKAPDVVGKIAPEIKAGKYTYKDLEKYPGFKQLMFPDLYNRIKPGAPPLGGNIPEFEIIPTRQYYWSLPIAEATKKNLGKTKLDGAGYLKPETWLGGIPFPNPSGEFKAQQIMYNWEKRYISWELNYWLFQYVTSWNKRLNVDSEGSAVIPTIRFAGRCLIPPYGWFDDRAEKNREFKAFVLTFLTPRDLAGMGQYGLFYLEPSKIDSQMVYIPSMRRIRKMSATDTQDPVGGFDLVYDDNEGFMQKLNPKIYPYKFEVLEEREYLVVTNSLDGSEYVASKGVELRNIKMERRPLYVVKLTQLDSNYVYSKRIFYIDKEMFVAYHNEYFDQKGRLYRTWETNYGWVPEMGMLNWCGSFLLMRDHVDLHTSISGPSYQLPAKWERGDVSLGGLVGKEIK